MIAGFVGKNCEQANPCLSSPCQNSGLCRSVATSNVLSYICICLTNEFMGINCEKSIHFLVKNGDINFYV